MYLSNFARKISESRMLFFKYFFLIYDIGISKPLKKSKIHFKKHFETASATKTTLRIPVDAKKSLSQ
jgi:hypothetical protein